MEAQAQPSVEIKSTESNTLILDNGSHQLRLGFKDSTTPLRIAPNCAVKTKNNKHRLIGEEIEQFVGDLSGLVYRRPFDKGYLINWDLQKEIWDLEHAQKRINEKIDPSNTKLLMTEPLFTPDILAKISDQVLFEEYGFESVLTASAPGLSWLHHQSTQKSPSPCGLVVDVGYSFTHVVPFYDNHLVNYGVKRINVGGKLLTNYLKEIISYRYYNMMEETFLINIIKEKLCYVSQNFLQDLASTKRRDNKIRREYVLPDYALNKYGYIKGQESPPAGYDPKDEQILVMNNERITVPEILFNPSDIGIYQAGVPETIVQSVESMHRDMHPAMYSNIVLMGGCTQLQGFKERLDKELRALVPAEYPINITMPNNPTLTAFEGGKLLANQPDFNKRAVTKAEYAEYGHVICKRKFGLL